jgi:hemerythrin-like domain-containing protein
MILFSTAQSLTRRGAIAGLGAAGYFLAVSPTNAAEQKESKDKGGEDVGATEDLMREHGVLRRVLIVYTQMPGMLRKSDAHVDAKALNDAAKLFRDFGETYHEHTLEEEHIFPQLRQKGGENARLVNILLRQHERGREITRYIIEQTEGGHIGDSERLAHACEAMVRMYEPHAAWEDTRIFPAWKKLHSKAELDEIAEEFEEIEHKMFGKDGFDDALHRVERVEQGLGLSDLDRYTAPPMQTASAKPR